jgi:hypothetical protein
MTAPSLAVPFVASALLAGCATTYDVRFTVPVDGRPATLVRPWKPGSWDRRPDYCENAFFALKDGDDAAAAKNLDYALRHEGGSDEEHFAATWDSAVHREMHQDWLTAALLLAQAQRRAGELGSKLGPEYDDELRFAAAAAAHAPASAYPRLSGGDWDGRFPIACAGEASRTVERIRLDWLGSEEPFAAARDGCRLSLLDGWISGAVEASGASFVRAYHMRSVGKIVMSGASALVMEGGHIQTSLELGDDASALVVDAVVGTAALRGHARLRARGGEWSFVGCDGDASIVIERAAVDSAGVRTAGRCRVELRAVTVKGRLDQTGGGQIVVE